MIRTRKRDDDSQYNNSIQSDTTSLAALDASSMSATGSRSSLTFSSSKAKHRPRKRQRKSLTDALQSISLDKDKGVPEQILKMGDFPFSSKSVSFTTGSTFVFGGSEHSSLNTKQQSDRRIDQENGTSGDGDIYYDDDNSQLTASSDERQSRDGMEDDYDEEEDDEDSQSKRLANMTDMEKAQRKVMLELVFGKDHREARKGGEKGSLSDREVSSCIRLSPGLINPMVPCPLATPPPTPISAAMTASQTTMPKMRTSSSKRDPADRKIDELLRQSLKNLREGSHPLQLPKLGSNEKDNDDVYFDTPLKTQDDMAIDPKIYSPRMPQGMPTTTTHISMVVENPTIGGLPNGPESSIAGPIQQQLPSEARPMGLQRSTSLPGGMEMMAESSAMEMDG